MAADDIARGALQLIRWGKKLAPATADEIAKFGPQAARVKALLRVIENTSGDAAKLASGVGYRKIKGLPYISEAGDTADEVADLSGRAVASRRAARAADINAILEQDIKKRSGLLLSVPAMYAARGETVSDIIEPKVYKSLTMPMAIAKRFDMSVPNAPEGFTAIARSLGEQGLITGPKTIEQARRLSMESPTFTQLVMSFVQDGMSFEEAMAAARALGL